MCSHATHYVGGMFGNYHVLKSSFRIGDILGTYTLRDPNSPM